MNFDSKFFGAEAVIAQDRRFAGSRYAEMRHALFASSYYQTWGGNGEPPLPTYEVTLGRALAGIWAKMWRFQQAANRIVDSHADMRWGPDGKGFRRIVHPNGVCLFGKWKINPAPAKTSYTGYFKPGSEGLVIARYSTCCTETRRGHYRSLAMVGKLFPTMNPNHTEVLRPANFITQEDFGGMKTDYINYAELSNAPDTTPWRRGAGLPVLLITGIVLMRSDKQPTARQLYPIAELGKPETEPTLAPEFMRLIVPSNQRRIPGDGLDFRDEILEQIYDKGDPVPRHTLTFNIEVSDEGEERGTLVQRRTIHNWSPIGSIVFDEAVASYNGDFVFHAHHPPWRNDRNDPNSLARKPRA